MQIRQPTDENKALMKSNGLNVDRRLVVWEDREVLEVISKRTKQRRVLKKRRREMLRELVIVSMLLVCMVAYIVVIKGEKD